MVVVVDVLLILPEFLRVRRTLGLLHFACGVAEVKCIVVTTVCVSVCLSLAAFPHYCTDSDVSCGMVGGAL